MPEATGYVLVLSKGRLSLLQDRLTLEDRFAEPVRVTSPPSASPIAAPTRAGRGAGEGSSRLGTRRIPDSSPCACLSAAER
jgi:hypothetical protein